PSSLTSGEETSLPAPSLGARGRPGCARPSTALWGGGSRRPVPTEAQGACARGTWAGSATATRGPYHIPVGPSPTTRPPKLGQGCPLSTGSGEPGRPGGDLCRRQDIGTR